MVNFRSILYNSSVLVLCMYTKVSFVLFFVSFFLDNDTYICYNIDRNKEQGRSPQHERMVTMMNAIEKINELMIARRTLADEASTKVDMIDAMLGNFPVEYASKIDVINAELEALKAEYPFKAFYYNTVSVNVGYFRTYEEAEKSLENYTDNLRVIKNIMTNEETTFAGKEC